MQASLAYKRTESYSHAPVSWRVFQHPASPAKSTREFRGGAHRFLQIQGKGKKWTIASAWPTAHMKRHPTSAFLNYCRGSLQTLLPLLSKRVETSSVLSPS